MRRAAFFVEGKTESIFIENLLITIAGSKNLVIQKAEGYGGKKVPRQIVFSPVGNISSADFYVLIVDSVGDSRVLSDLIEQYQSLMNKGYSVIFACRDVAPDFMRSDIPRLRQMADTVLNQSLGSGHVAIPIFSVMETEAWFFPDYADFTKLKRSLDKKYMLANFGIDQVDGNLELIDRPSETMKGIHKSVRLEYRKREREIRAIMSIIDFQQLVASGHRRFSDLENLVSRINTFFSV